MSVTNWSLWSKQGSANPPYSYGPSASYQSGPPTTYHQPRSPAQYQTAPPVPSLGASAPVPGMVPNQMFPHSAATNSTSRLLPSSNQGFVQRPGLSPVQPSSPTQAQAQAQPAPPAPPPTVQTADTSKVSGMWIADARLVSICCRTIEFLVLLAD